MIDLNTVISPGSGLQLTNALNINDRGEILAKSIPAGVTPVDDEDFGHVVLLVPCDEERGDCVNQLAGATSSISSFPRKGAEQQLTTRKAMRAWRERFTEWQTKSGPERQ
jgi:hypothetical protein